MIPEGLIAFRDAVMCVPLHNFNANQIISLENPFSVPMNILSDDCFSNKIFVRPDYLDLQKHIFTLINPLEVRKPRVAVLGNPGTGKTYFGLFLLVYCIRNGFTVVYESNFLNKLYLFSSDEIVSFSNRKDPRFESILAQRATIYIVDGMVPVHANARTILVTSPKHEIYHDFATKRTAPAVALYMPTWNLNELTVLREAVFPSVGQKDMEALIVRWGGIPRAVLEDAAANKLSWESKDEDALQSAIGYCSIDDLVETVKEGSERFLMSHRLLHVHCSATFRKLGYVFASDFVRDRVLRRLVQKERHRLLLFATFADGTSMNGGLRGQVFEYFAHAWLASGLKVFSIRALNDPAVAVKSPPTIKWGRLNIQVFHKGEFPFRPLPDLTYLQPESRNFAAVDAIISLAHDDAPLLLQMAVGAHHPISAARLNDLLNSIGPVSALFFVVPRDVYPKYTHQPYYDLDGHIVRPSFKLADLPQFALCIDLVEEVLGEALDAMAE